MIIKKTFDLLHQVNRELFIFVVSSFVGQDYRVRWKMMNIGGVRCSFQSEGSGSGCPGYLNHPPSFEIVKLKF